MLTCLAVVLVGVWLIVSSQSRLSDTATLIFGIAVAVLALIDLLRPYVYNRPPPG
jgi:multisubunit Na+/H+ antiporter MnhE subunit